MIIAGEMTKSELFELAHQITKFKNIAYFGSYQKAFAYVLRDLYARGYQTAAPAFQIHEPAAWLGISRK